MLPDIAQGSTVDMTRRRFLWRCSVRLMPQTPDAESRKKVPSQKILAIFACSNPRCFAQRKTSSSTVPELKITRGTAPTDCNRDDPVYMRLRRVRGRRFSSATSSSRSTRHTDTDCSSFPRDLHIAIRTHVRRSNDARNSWFHRREYSCFRTR